MFGDIKHKREFYFPANARKISHKLSSAVVYASEGEGPRGDQRFYLTGFRGKAQKPAFNYYYTSAEKREAKAKSFFESVKASEQRKIEQREAAKAAAASHDVKVGDVFRASWGYDQTNIDYYECVKLVGKTMMEVREIGCERVDAGSWAQYKTVPAVGVYVGKAQRKKIQRYEGGAPHFSVNSFSNAYRMEPSAMIGNKAVYNASHETNYA